MLYKRTGVDPEVLATWLQGWTLARGTSAPLPFDEGFRVNVGWPEQRVRYVFPALSPSFRQLAATIHDPRIFLKVCASPEALLTWLPTRWALQPQGFLMQVTQKMRPGPTAIPPGYTLHLHMEGPVHIARMLTAEGAEAAIARMVLVARSAIYDRVETQPEHRRRGLAGILMTALEAIAAQHHAHRGLLVATESGKALYESLGWQLCSLYTSVVIPGSL